MFKPLLTGLGAGRVRSRPVVPPLDMPTVIAVRGEPRPLRVRVHANARRMILRFDVRTGEGKLTVPRGTPASAALAFLAQCQRWTDSHAPELPDQQDAPFLQVLPFGGTDHRIVPTGRIRGTVSRTTECELHVPGEPHRIMPRLARYLKSEAEQTLTPQVIALSERLGKRVSSIRYRDPRAQWGSCSSRRIITLSWRVMMAPPQAQTYLVAHEVAHLVEMNHSRRFWKVVESLDLDWKAGQKALKSAEKKLMAIRFS